MYSLLSKEEENTIKLLLDLADGDIQLFTKALRTTKGSPRKCEDVIRRILELKKEKREAQEERKFFEGIINSDRAAI